MSTTQIASGIVVAVLIFWSVGAYNRLVRLCNVITTAYAQIDLQFKRRHELIAQLVEAAGPAWPDDERETLEALTAASNQAKAAADMARSRPMAANAMKSLSIAEQVLTAALARFMALLPPQADTSDETGLRGPLGELATVEAQIAFGRQLFNNAALDYNAAAHQFPTRLLANLFGFRAAGLLQASGSEAEHSAARSQ